MTEVNDGSMRQLSLSELVELDGARISSEFDRAIRRAAGDCEDRPADSRTRKVILQLEFIPVLDSQGLCESVKCAAQIKDTVPTRKSRVYDFGLRRGGMFVFSPNSLGDHKQQSMDFNEE